MPAGRPKKIESPDMMWELFQKYVKETKSTPILVHDFIGKEGRSEYRERERPLTMEGFSCWVADNGYMWGIYDYFNNKGGGYKEFSSICSRIKEKIRQDQITGGMVGIYNPSITQRLNGLVDKTESKVTVEQPLFSDEDKDK